jgi:hypothetical protein
VREAKARSAVTSREKATVTQKDEGQDKGQDKGQDEGRDEGQVLVPGTPPRQVPLPIRSPEAQPTLVFCLFPEEETFMPTASTAPPRLAEEEGRGKRKRALTAKYQQSVKDGLLKGLRQDR